MTTQQASRHSVHRGTVWTTHVATGLACLVVILGCTPVQNQTLEDNVSSLAGPSHRTYTVQYLPQVQVKLDGHLNEAQWSLAILESDFIFPWQDRMAPRTDFRALCDDHYFYFAFRVIDADLFVLPDLPEEGYAVFEDRVEMYFAHAELLLP